MEASSPAGERTDMQVIKKIYPIIKEKKDEQYIQTPAYSTGDAGQ
jgi:hypothetical protein